LTQFFLKKRYSFAAKSIYAYGEAALNFLLLMKSTCHWKLVYMYVSCQQQRLFSGDGIGMGGLAWSPRRKIHHLRFSPSSPLQADSSTHYYGSVLIHVLDKSKEQD
jgi:hypothetical protein